MLSTSNSQRLDQAFNNVGHEIRLGSLEERPKDPFLGSHTFYFSRELFSLERRKIERIPAILGPKHAEQETVHPKYKRAPNEDCHLLCLCILHSRDFQGERDCRKGQDSVCFRKGISISAMSWWKRPIFHSIEGATYIWQQQFASPARIGLKTHQQSMKYHLVHYQPHMALS